MNKYFILCIWLFVSCTNNSGTKKSTEINSLPEEVTFVKEKLDSILAKGILKFIDLGYRQMFPDVQLDESFIAVYFIIRPEYATTNYPDSVVRISYNYNTFRGDEKGLKYYKGMLDIGGYNVAIFDFGDFGEINFGDKYYNADSLKQIPLDRFKSYSMEAFVGDAYYMVEDVYYVIDGKLKNFWIP